MPLEIRGAHFLIRSAQLVRGRLRIGPASSKHPLDGQILLEENWFLSHRQGQQLGSEFCTQQHYFTKVGTSANMQTTRLSSSNAYDARTGGKAVCLHVAYAVMEGTHIQI